MVEEDRSPDCPGPDVLAMHVAGDLDPQTAKAVAKHIGACGSCWREVEDLMAGEELAAQLRQAAGTEKEASIRQRLQKSLGGGYDLLEALGSGAHGMVFKAKDLGLNRMVAVKTLGQDGEADRIPAIVREAQNLARINHPGVATVYAVVDQSDPPLIIMEFVDGSPITDALASRPFSQQLDGFRQALQAVAELHRRRIVHRDLKPANILVDLQGHVKLVDFGIVQDAGHQQFIRIEGTPAYVAPEQSLGQPASPAGDVFSLGVILYELLTGNRPFGGQTTEKIIESVRHENPKLPRALREEIPGPLQAICLAALEKDPTHRYQSAKHFLMDLERFLSGEAVTANPTLLDAILDHGIERQVGELHRWQKDRMISTREYDYFMDIYDRLRHREEFWVLDSRRISFSQVVLHLGAWAFVVSGFLMLAFPWPQIGAMRAVLPAALLFAMLAGGEILWRRRTRRVALVLFISATALCPIAVSTLLKHANWLVGGPVDQNLLLDILSNQQLLAASIVAVALATFLWMRTGTSAFAIIWALSVVLLATGIFSMMGMRDALMNKSYSRLAGWYLWPGLTLLASAMALDLRWRVQRFAGPLYLISVALLLASLTIIARYGPTLQWAGIVEWVQEDRLWRHIKYGFMINGFVYMLLGLLASRSRRSRWLRKTGTLLLWLAPSHILIPILMLEGEWPISGSTWTATEILLPVAALVFVFASVPKQMKSFFFSGLAYLALSVQRLTSRHFENVFSWPMALIFAGLILVVVAWRYPMLFDKQQSRRSHY